ncbi:MAG TPA: sulfatase-like hydrolase/transferase [Thermoanaerobaculia bacterium]|jgi:arylsulfatase A-like enzyme/tetratricopeptide (TPR) repeat protein
MRFPARAVALLLAWIFLGCACSKQPLTFPRAPVVLISVDTVRADHLPSYGYGRVETPHLDALREDSILYENAYSPVPLTLPAHAALLTGLLPYQNGVRDNIGFRLARFHPTLAALLQKKGYATGAAVSSYVLQSDRGLNAGFDFYDAEFTSTSADERPGAQTAERLEKWLDTVRDKPVFLFLHLYEPHAPYAPPEPYKSRYAANPYDGEIAAADAVVGGFLDALRERALYDRAIVFFLSDHGEGLKDHGEDEHGVFLYREAIRVPLFLKLPGSRNAGGNVAAPVGLVDVLPTVAALLGLPVPKDLPGVPLPFEKRGVGSERRIYSETLYPRLQLGWSDLASLTDARYQYIEAPRPELYDLLADPREKNDLSRSKPPAFRSMRSELESLARPLQAPGPGTPEEIKRLASLGYIGVLPGTLLEKGLPDPKDRVDTLRKLKELFALFYAKNDREAVAAAKEVLSEDPRILSAWRMMGESLARTGKIEEAARVVEKGIEQAGTSGVGEEISQAYDQLASLLDRAGRQGESDRVLREAIRQNLATEQMKRRLAKSLTETGRSPEALALLSPLAASRDAATLDLLGVAQAESGRLPEARASFLRALELEAESVDVLFHLGTLSLREKDPAAARDWFEKALRLKPSAPGTLTSLGLAQVQLGDDAGALDSWSKAISLDPTQYDALFNLAVLSGRTGRYDQARRALQRFLSSAPPERYAANIAEARRLLRSLAARKS